MSFSATGARRPLQSKQKKNPFLQRTTSSPLNSLPRRKPSQTPATKKRAASEDPVSFVERLDDTGIVTNLPPRGVDQNVVDLMKYILDHIWNEIPERAAGMNSVRIAEVLNFRRNLPRIVSIAHIHAVSKSATTTEREIARLVQAGILRKVNILARGKGGTGEGVVLVADWEAAVDDAAGLDDELKETYKKLLREYPTSATVDSSNFDAADATKLVHAGFLTSTSALSGATGQIFSRPGAWTLGKPSTIATSAATGTLAAVGGLGAVHESGGGGKGFQTSFTRTASSNITGDLTFALPATGAYLRVLTEARSHLLQIIAKSSPRYKEVTMDMLRERWDGGIPTEDAASRAKRARGDFTGVLPGKTKKWKTFYGLDFTWVLKECLGSGLIECFNTGSVGLAVRAV